MGSQGKGLTLCLGLLVLAVSSVSVSEAGENSRISNSREGRFLSAHLDLLSAASSLFPSLKSRYDSTEEEEEEDLITDSSSLSFSKADKLVATENDLSESETIRDMTDSLQDLQTFGVKLSDLEEEISEHVDTLDASGGDPPAELQDVFSASKTKGRLRIPSRPEGTPQPLLIICEDPNHCPPPVPSYHHPYKRPHYGPGPGLNICRDPLNCPGYRPGRRPYRIKKPAKPAPTYQPVESDGDKPSYKKYGYNPNKPSNPTIWRQQVMEVDAMSLTELKDVIKEAAMEEVEEEKLEKLVINTEEMTTVAPIIEDAINKMTMTELKEFIMDVVVENKNNIEVPEVVENDVHLMTRAELKDVVKDTVAMNDAEEEVVAPIIEETVDRLTSNELKEVVMEIVEKEKSEEIVVPLVQDAINHMSMDELKEFIAEAVMKESDQTDEIIEPLVEEAVKEMSKNELKEFVMEKIVEKEEEESLITTGPETTAMTMQDLEHLMENEEEDTEEENITELTDIKDINNMSMQELRDFIEKNSVKPVTEKPTQKPKMAIKDGILFKDGMTMKEIEAEEMGMTVKELVGKEEGLNSREIGQVKEGISVEEMIAMKNDLSVPEMIAMKNDLSVEEVMTIKDVLPAAAIVQTRPDIPVEEAIALKSNMTIEELVAMKNDIPVEEIIELKDELEMDDIMKLEDGITKKDALAIIDEEMSVEEVIEMKKILEEDEVIRLGGVQIESEKFPNFANEETEIINIDNEEGGVSFIEVMPNKEVLENPNPNEGVVSENLFEINRNKMKDSHREILESVRNTRPNESFKQNNKKDRKKLKMKMRPLRVKVRKPLASEETEESDLEIEALDESFGLKNVNPNTVDKLVLEPTPAVPGLPVLEDPNVPKNVNQFENFGPSLNIPINNVKTIDYQSEEVADSDYPIYDDSGDNTSLEAEEEAPVVTKSQFIPPSKMSDMPKLPIFSNFPMMKPHEFINLITEEGELPDFKDEFMKEDAFMTFSNPDRPESIGIEVFPDQNQDPMTKDDLDSFLDVFEEEEISEEVRPVRMPESSTKPARIHPNHRYPVRTRQPFTVRPKGSVVRHSYMKNSYSHPTGNDNYKYEEPYRKPYDTSNTALFREIAQNKDSRFKRKPYQESNKHQQKFNSATETKVKPFTHFASDEEKETVVEADYNDPTLVGLNFYKQYGQHDDRPLRLSTTAAPVPVTPFKDDADRDKKRPGEIRFGGMSFALPPPGEFPDIPQEEAEDFDYYNYDNRPISDVYPDHPLSQVYPDRPVSDIFRDIPEQKQDPSFPTAFPPKSDADNSFERFFTENKYIDNPFGKDFIKLEVDLDRFDTNKTNIHGFPDTPSYSMDSDFRTPPKVKNNKRKHKKPLYRPPPVLTEYSPPFSKKDSQTPEYRHQEPEYRHQLPEETISDFNIDKSSSEPAPLSGLSSLMGEFEKLMGQQSQWLKMAWNGRDEAMAAAA